MKAQLPMCTQNPARAVQRSLQAMLANLHPYPWHRRSQQKTAIAPVKCAQAATKDIAK
ncbi:MAG: hypothetical protein IPH37_01550 [Burkholderiales bacterium]|nr:hypothetical protein [Burkholderiales bacterium]